MAFTMHSHSGQFCPGHAKDQLEDVIQHAINVGYKTMGLTEHMPRFSLNDLYPEEIGETQEESQKSLDILVPRHADYLVEAKRLRAAYSSKIHILIGFEGEWMRNEYGDHVRNLAADPVIDYFIGSIHHVNGIPIDFDKAFYAKALESAGDGEEALYERYYDEQYEMLTTLRPRIVGHFDLIRLMSAEPGRDIRKWAGVWERILRNLGVVVSNGGMLECNTSALRKGLAEPYPCRVIAEEYLRLGGQFTFSDDSHGIAQIATNYKRGLDYLRTLGVTDVFTFEKKDSGEVCNKRVSLDEFDDSLRVY